MLHLLWCSRRRGSLWGLPLLYGPLPATPGHILFEFVHAHDVWTAAPWSAAVLSAHSYRVDGCSWLDELQWLASNSDPPLRSGWGDLTAGQVARKLLVMWKVYWWPHWSALPYPDFPNLALDDDQSFDQYTLLSNPDLGGHHWDEAVWDPAWTEAYSAYFSFHIHAVARDAASVPCLYSLARCSLWFGFQRSGEDYLYDPHMVYDPEVDLPVDCT